MPVAKYTALANITAVSNMATITFSNIPQTYRDLYIVASFKSNSDYVNARYRINGATSAIYSSVFGYGNGSSAGGGTNDNQPYGYISAGSVVWASAASVNNTIMHFMDYRDTSKIRVALERTSIPTSTAFAGAAMVAHRWPGTEAITSLEFSIAGSFAAGTTVALYGVM